MRNRVKNSFSARLSLLILIITSVIFLLAIGVASSLSHIELVDEAKTSSIHLLDATISDIENYFQSVETAVATASLFVDENRNDEKLLYFITRKLVEQNPYIVGSTVAFKSGYFAGKHFYAPYSYRENGVGDIKSKQLGTPQYDYFFMEWYQIPSLSGEQLWTEPYFDDGGANCLMSTFSYPIKDKDGQVYAILTADVPLTWITKSLASVKPYPNSEVSLVSRCGAYVTIDEDESLKGETIFSTAYTAGDVTITSIAKKMSSGEKGLVQYERNAQKSFAVFGPLSNGWSVSFTCKYSDILERATKSVLFILLVGLFGVALLAVASYNIIRRQTEPLLLFSESAESIAHGNFDTQLPAIESQDEVRKLRDSFDYMQSSLKTYIEELKHTTMEKERYESELNVAANIQKAMLLKDFPADGSLDCHAMLRPAKEVGGDLYDFYRIGHKLYFTVGDVSGKGVPASLFMAITKALFHFVVQMGCPLDEVVSRMNNTISENNETGMFVTLFVGCLDLETGELQFCNAGHNPAVIISPEGEAKFLEQKPNLAIGVFSDFPYQLQSVNIEKGSCFVLYTDGVTEAERVDKRQYGEERLLAWSSFAAKTYDSAMNACESLYSDVRKFTEGNEQNDDITILTIKFI